MKQYLFLMITLVLFACGGGDDGDAPSGGSEYLNVSKDIVVSQGNTTTTLQISASPNLDWKISSDQQWVSFSQQSGRGSANVTVTVTVNPSSTESRSAIIVVSSKSYSRECTLKQEPNGAYVDLSVTSLDFTGSASSQQFTVLSNADWIVVEPDEEWITVSPRGKQQESTVVTVQVKDNPVESIRKKVFTIKGGNVSKQVEITQAGRSTEFSVTPTSLTAGAVANSVSFNIVGDALWTAKSNQDWATLSEVSGGGNKTITVSLSDNANEASRTAEITISSSSKSEKVIITQAGGSKPSIMEIKQADITEVTQSSAVVTFSYTSQFPVLEYGVCYSLQNSSPTLNDRHLSDTGSALQDSKSFKISDLSPGTIYYVCAYAKSSVGIQYSNVVSFTTVSDVPGGDDNVTPSRM